MSKSFMTTLAIGVSQLRIGEAEREGRTPSHDGEYLMIYAVEDEWIGEDGGGSFGEDDLFGGFNEDDPDDEESTALLRRIEEAIKTPDEIIAIGTELDTNFSSGVAEIMKIMGWVVEMHDKEYS